MQPDQLFTLKPESGAAVSVTGPVIWALQVPMLLAQEIPPPVTEPEVESMRTFTV
jgi:hypothetical protein